MVRIYVAFTCCVLLVGGLCLSSCDFSTQMAEFDAIGNDHKVELYSGGQLIKEYMSKGKPKSPTNSDGYLFMNKETGNLVEVSGTVVMESL